MSETRALPFCIKNSGVKYISWFMLMNFYGVAYYQQFITVNDLVHILVAVFTWLNIYYYAMQVYNTYCIFYTIPVLWKAGVICRGERQETCWTHWEDQERGRNCSYSLPYEYPHCHACLLLAIGEWSVWEAAGYSASAGTWSPCQHQHHNRR